MLKLMLRLLMLVALSGAATLVRADALHDLVVATQVDNPQAVGKLLASGLGPNSDDPVSGEPVLILALREDASAVFNVLMAHKDIQIERTAPNGNRPLMMAAFKRNKRAVALLLVKGAVVNHPGWTALHYAAAAGDDDITALLLDHHAYIDTETPSKLTPLMVAAREGQESTVKLLLQNGADATLKNNEQITAAQIAERADKPRIADAINAHLSLRPFLNR